MSSPLRQWNARKKTKTYRFNKGSLRMRWHCFSETHKSADIR
jgi:hypothetical protein